MQRQLPSLRQTALARRLFSSPPPAPALVRFQHASATTAAEPTTTPNLAQDPVPSSSRLTIQDLDKALLLSGLPASTLPSDISRFLHKYGSRTQHLQQVTLLLDRNMQFFGSALVAFHEPDRCAQVHAALVDASTPVPGHTKPPLRIGHAGPLSFKRVDLAQPPWSELATNLGGGGARALLVDVGQKRYFGRTVAVRGFSEDVHPNQVLAWVKQATGVEPIPSAPTEAKPSELVQTLPGTDNTTRKPVFLLRFNTAAEAHRAARTLDCTTAKLHNPFFVKAHVVW